MQIVDLDELYGDYAAVNKKRYERLRNTMIKHFDCQPDNYYSCPGRCEIIGNHTDHNGGKVIAASINMDTIAAAAAGRDSYIRILSDGYKSEMCIDTESLINKCESDLDKMSKNEKLIAGICTDRKSVV